MSAGVSDSKIMTANGILSKLFYRFVKHRNSNLCRRPSALCLPLACQPDPAVLYSRAMKSRVPPAMHGIPPLRLPHTQQPDEEAEAEAVPPRSAPASIDVRSSRIRQIEQEHLQRVHNIIMDRRDGDNPEKADLRLNTDIDNIDADEFSDAEDMETKTSELDILLAQYQQQLLNEGTFDGKTKTPSKTSMKSRTRNKGSLSKISVSQLVKPRLPPSLKKKSSKNSGKTSDTTNVDESINITPEMNNVLDNLLKDLNENGFLATEDAQAINETTMNEIGTSKCSNTRTSGLNKMDQDGFNANQEAEKKTVSPDAMFYKMEEFNQMKMSNSYYQEHYEEPVTMTTFMQEKANLNQSSSSHTCFSQNPNRVNHDRPSSAMSNSSASGERRVKKPGSAKGSKNSPGRCSVKKSPWTSTGQKIVPKICTDEQTALELHRSKSYIVHLIDRALSRELGTIPEEKSSKQYVDLDPVTACDYVSAAPAVKNMDTDVCLEITHTRPASVAGNQNPPTNPQTSTQTHIRMEGSKGEPSRGEGELLYSNRSDEPLYIKQLQQIRWGHLKKIQSEMKRLEDLERFLDSCSSENQ